VVYRKEGLLEYLEARNRHLLEICRVQSKLVAADFDLDEFMQMSVTLLRSVFETGGVVVELVDGEEMVYVAIDADHARYHGLRLSKATSLSGRAAAEGRLLHCVDTHEDPRVDRAACEKIGIRSMVCAPLFQDGRVVGVLKAFDAAPDAFDRDDIETVSLVAETLGAALAKQIQHGEREGLMIELAMARDEAEAEARRAHMAEAMGGLGRWRYDYEANRSEWSDQMYDLHGLPRGGEIDSDAVMARVHPEDIDRVRALVREPRPLGVIGPFIDFRLTRADGQERRMQAMTTLELDAQGRRTAVMGVLRDVTEQYEREQALAKARREAEAAARTKAAFLANMTHELRTPLTAVLGFARLVERRADVGEESRGLVRRILNAGEALLHTINDLLDFSKLEDGQVEIRPRPVAVEACAREALELLAAQAGAKRLALELTIDPATPERALLDPDRVRQVLLNLTGNAVKFTETGAVAVSVAPSADGEALVWTVADTGPGISAEGVERLFVRFSQVEGGGQDGSGGTGLGLAICKGLVEAMGGTIGVDSAPGRGSRFWFSLPAPPVDEGAEVEDHAVCVNGRKVLVADDNPANRVLLRTILQAFGAEVAEACDGGEAVDLAEQGAFDLILMDLRMPGLDGISAARRIREAAGERPTPILAFSADRYPELDGALFRGAVPKPIEPETLLAAMAQAMR
jgi:PAS domain S-box-containing protein